jgi:hypothetical protein
MMEAVRTSETSVDNHFTRQYNPEDSSEHHTRRRENLKSQITVILLQTKVIRHQQIIKEMHQEHILIRVIILSVSLSNPRFSSAI